MDKFQPVQRVTLFPTHPVLFWIIILIQWHDHNIILFTLEIGSSPTSTHLASGTPSNAEMSLYPIVCVYVWLLRTVRECGAFVIDYGCFQNAVHIANAAK